MEEKEERFELVEKQAIGRMREITILLDRYTGVQYLSYQSGDGNGITPLLGRDGRPLIRNMTFPHK